MRLGCAWRCVTAALENITLATHRSADATSNLGREVGQRRSPPDPAEGGVDEGHHGVEVGTRNRPNIKMMA